MNLDRVNRIRAGLGAPPLDGKPRQPEAAKKAVRLPQPGDVFAIVILKITGQRTSSCGKCAIRKQQMNRWGWLGCMKPINQKIIKAWIVEEALARGHKIKDRQLTGLLKAAFKELMLKNG